MDGNDSADSLRAGDKKGGLNEAVENLVSSRICLQPGDFRQVRPFITGDGKAMLAANFREGGPKKLASLSPKSHYLALEHFIFTSS